MENHYISSMIYAHRMAENNNPAENSSSTAVKMNFIRKSLKKKKEKKVAAPDGTVLNTSHAASDTQSKINLLYYYFLCDLLI